MSGRQELGEIRDRYQVAADDMVDYFPKMGVFGGLVPGSERLTLTEARMLDDLVEKQGAGGFRRFVDIKQKAADESRRLYANVPVPDDIAQQSAAYWQNNDGHRDAFRHAYWNALLVREYGHDWAKAFTTAHEGVPYNDANREAMDLYNNEVGRAIAVARPDASNADPVGRHTGSGSYHEQWACMDCRSN